MFMIALISQAQLGNLRCTPQSYNMCEPSPPHKSQPRRQAHAAGGGALYVISYIWS